MPRQPQPAPLNGALVISKPQGRTSHDMVDALRHLAGFRQIGHLGTLDPLATGVLVMLLGKATRLVRFYSGRRKRYTVGFRFGYATNTYDSEGEAQGPDSAPQLDRVQLESFAAESMGRFAQMPPQFSAKKVHGRPAYELARKNVEFELKPADVELFEFRLTEVEGSIARYTIECSSGTYVRSLAHDMGKKMGCGAHLAEICRTAVGEFSIEQAIPIQELAAAARDGKWKHRIIPLENLLTNYPRVNVLPVLEKRVRHGGRFTVMTSQVQPAYLELPPGATTHLDADPSEPLRLRVFSQEGKLLAIAEAVLPRTYQPIVVFDPLP
ncbi:MAG TPA: tRNA pseudouridine(55) synthase TruB [Candidatus Acidoferrum sp.]|nr:tRNA pseudouridine(55) synthase TruB [Candidatus Acidoferrum sp.]